MVNTDPSNIKYLLVISQRS